MRPEIEEEFTFDEVVAEIESILRKSDCELIWRVAELLYDLGAMDAKINQYHQGVRMFYRFRSPTNAHCCNNETNDS